MTSKLVKFLFAASLLLNCAVFITIGYVHFSQSSDWISPFGVKIKQGEFLFERLSLQPKQIKILQNGARIFRKEVDKKRREILKKRKKLISLLRAKTNNTAEIQSVINGISSTQRDVQQMVVQHILENKVVLDTQQQKKFFDLIESSMQAGMQTGCLAPKKN